MITMKLAAALFVALALISCSTNIPTAQLTSTVDLSSLSPTVSITATSPTETRTPQATPRSTYTSTPLAKISPYATKEVLLKYTHSRAALGGPEEFFDVFFGNNSPREMTELVLYSDGQLILQKTPESIVTKILTESEVHQLLFKLDEMGFNMTDTNQKHDDTDLLYDFVGRYQQVGVTDGAYTCLSMRSDEICYYEPYADFLAPHVKAFFQYMDDYTPNNTTLYEPDRILLLPSQGQGLYRSFVEQPSGTHISWPSDLPPLNTAQEKYIYLEEEKAKEFFSLVGRSPTPMVVSENGKEYSVVFAIILPHENLSQP